MTLLKQLCHIMFSDTHFQIFRHPVKGFFLLLFFNPHPFFGIFIFVNTSKHRKRISFSNVCSLHTYRNRNIKIVATHSSQPLINSLPMVAVTSKSIGVSREATSLYIYMCIYIYIY